MSGRYKYRLRLKRSEVPPAPERSEVPPAPERSEEDMPLSWMLEHQGAIIVAQQRRR